MQFHSVTSNWLCVTSCTWYMTISNKERNKWKYLVCEIVSPLVHAQVRYIRTGKSRVKTMQTLCENINHRHVITTDLRAQDVTTGAI